MSGLTTIKLSSEDLKKEQERQRKRGGLIFKTFKKGKVKVVVGAKLLPIVMFVADDVELMLAVATPLLNVSKAVAVSVTVLRK
jgi:hypothetical protein